MDEQELRLLDRIDTNANLIETNTSESLKVLQELLAEVKAARAAAGVPTAAEAPDRWHFTSTMLPEPGRVVIGFWPLSQTRWHMHPISQSRDVITGRPYWHHHDPCLDCATAPPRWTDMPLPPVGYRGAD